METTPSTEAAPLSVEGLSSPAALAKEQARMEALSSPAVGNARARMEVITLPATVHERAGMKATSTAAVGKERATAQPISSPAAGVKEPASITRQATCADWTSWVPPRTDPAVVMQVISKAYVDVERNFIRLMELNSDFTRQNMYLMCLDAASVEIFSALGIRCVPLGTLKYTSEHDIWKTRVRVVSCLVTAGYDVIMSDADALWLSDPMDYMNLPAHRNSSVVASRGNFPHGLEKMWGATICMGFILFRATGRAMDEFQDTMERIALQTGDDQISVNQAAHQLGITWDVKSDMRLTESTGVGRGAIANLSGDDEPFEVILLPHDRFTRFCTSTPISAETTVVAHCHSNKKEALGRRVSWMLDANLWSIDVSDP